MSNWHDVPSDGAGNDETPGWSPYDDDETPTAVPSSPTPPDLTAPPTGSGRQPHLDDDDDNPFGGVTRIDGLVYSPEDISPEMQFQHQRIDAPLPPERPMPQPRSVQFAEPWKPGPEPKPLNPNQQGMPQPVRALLVSLIPLAILIGLGVLVYRIMQAYGLG